MIDISARYMRAPSRTDSKRDRAAEAMLSEETPQRGDISTEASSDKIDIMVKGNTDGPMEIDTWVTSKTICMMESEFSITAKLATDTSGSTRRVSGMVSGYTCEQAPMETPTSENTKKTIVRGLESSSSQGSRSGTLANGTKGCSMA